MPNYDIRNKETGEVTERFMSIAQLEVFLQENPSYEVAFLTSRIGDPYHLGVQKVPADFLKYIIEPMHVRNRSNKELRHRAPREI